MSCETRPIGCSSSSKDLEEQTVNRLGNWSNSNDYKTVTCSALNETVNQFSETVDQFIKQSNPTTIKQQHTVHND